MKAKAAVRVLREEDGAKPAPAALSRSTAKPKARAKKTRRAYLPAEERKRLIIQAAQKVFSRTSLTGARTRELAKAAQVNQATLFEHFSSKEELFVAAVIQPLLDAMRGLPERLQAFEAASTLKDRLAVSETACGLHLETMMQVYPLLVAALFSDPAIGKKLYREQIVPLLKERSRGTRAITRPGTDADLVTLANFGIFFAIAMDRAFTGKSVDIAETARKLTELSTFGFMRDSKSP